MKEQHGVHVYVFEPGPPPYITGEVFVPGRVVAELRAEHQPLSNWDPVVMTPSSWAMERGELLAAAGGPEALAAWAALETASSDEAYLADRARTLGRAIDHARAEGCPTAAELMRRVAPVVELEEYENSHNCRLDHPRLKLVH